MLELRDLASCSSRFAYYGRSIRELLDRFADRDASILRLLPHVDRFTADRDGMPTWPLAAPPVRTRLEAFFGERTTVGALAGWWTRADPRSMTRRLMEALLGAKEAVVESRHAFAATVLLRCVVPKRFPILATPQDLVPVATPYALQKERIRLHGGGRTSPWWQWPRLAFFVEDYDVYGTWLRGIFGDHGFDTPGEVDDGCWQLARCLGRARTCPDTGRYDRLCEAGTKALEDPVIGPLARRARKRDGQAASPLERFALFRAILENSGESAGATISWEDALRMLLPDPEVVRFVFADPARRPKETKGSTRLRWLEEWFGHHIVTTIRDANGYDDSPDTIGRHLDTYGGLIARRLETPEEPEPGSRRKR